MTSAQIRQSFLDFFKSKQHTIVPSSSLMPDSPNLLFTNAGMNQFVPIFLGERKADVDKWANVIPGLATRAADTQKCIRAGGKHNDLEDVGLDTYHHTFFEMLGNWSFGDYFKKDAIEWAWELVTGVWKFPKHRIYATVYKPGAGDPADFDQEAYDLWAAIFEKAGLDPKVHIVFGNKKDNFWMMGDTGPCGPCSELHVDLTPAGDTKGSLVNQGDSRCIEIWNLVFIQFNANADGSFSPLPAKHVDTGMGFERVTSILQCTDGFATFSRTISNYDTDIFRPIFDQLERMSGKKYTASLPKEGLGSATEQEKIDVAFRVIADHIRTLSFAIADGIQPGNTDRNYVLRRILRRAVKYGRTLGFHEPFFYKLVDVLVDTMGDVFPEIRAKQAHVKSVIRTEEESFNKTLDRGIELFGDVASAVNQAVDAVRIAPDAPEQAVKQMENAVRISPEIARQCLIALSGFQELVRNIAPQIPEMLRAEQLALEQAAKVLPRVVTALNQYPTFVQQAANAIKQFPSGEAFKLYDTYGFPPDLTGVMAREQGLSVSVEQFEKWMGQQRERARAAQKKTVIELSQVESTTPTKFIGYETLETPARVVEVVSFKDKTAVILDTSACYAEMGGQVGDTGELSGGGQLWRVTNTQKSGNTWLHFIETEVEQASGLSASASRRSTASGETPDVTAETAVPPSGSIVTLSVNAPRRHAIERHHTVTHIFHWALHEVVNREATQKGSYVGPEKLTFDFNCAPLTAQQLADIEKLVNERILENATVSWREVPYADVRSNPGIMQLFGEKYSDIVRVVQIGGGAGALDGYSMELCGGTHTRHTGEIGLFRIVGENAIAAGVRRVEAIAGLEAWQQANRELELIKTIAGKINAPIGELEKKIESMLAHQKELEKQLKAAQQKEAAGNAKSLLTKAETLNGTPAIIARVDGDGDTLQTITDSLKSQFKGVIVLGGASNGAVALVASVSSDFTTKFQAGKIIQAIAPIVGGKGGGRPDNARGGGKDASKLDEALAKARSLLG